MSVETVYEVPTNRKSLLPTVFKIDRAMVLGSGLVFTLGGAFIAEAAGWPTWVAVAVGLSMLPYAILLHRIVASGRFVGRIAKITMEADVAWVLGSLAILGFAGDASTTTGNWIIAVVALAVADVGVAKWIGIRRAVSRS